MIRLIILCFLVTFMTACSSIKLTRAGYEEASHQVIIKEGPIELRRYSNLNLVQTKMRDTEDSGFMRLFRYIDGNNSSKSKIAMTTPVFTSENSGERTMSFVLPAKIKKENVPTPSNEAVQTITRTSGLYASHRYAGRRVEGAPIKIQKQLLKWINNHDLQSKGVPINAFYDTPWTPPFLRRNELLIEVTQQ